MCICVTCRGIDLASVSMILNLYLRVIVSVSHFIYTLAMIANLKKTPGTKNIFIFNNLE